VSTQTALYDHSEPRQPSVPPQAMSPDSDLTRSLPSLQPKPSTSTANLATNESFSFYRSRRQTISAACEYCRAKKSKVRQDLSSHWFCSHANLMDLLKCTGERPACSLCVSKSIPCIYSTAPDETHSRALKRKHEELQIECDHYAKVFDFIRLRQEADVQEVVRRIRAGETLEAIVEHISEGELLLQLSVPALTTGPAPIETSHLSTDLPPSPKLPPNTHPAESEDKR
jgi:hypothetical protein